MRNHYDFKDGVRGKYAHRAWWWLSFAANDGFRGGVFTYATSFREAYDTATRLGLNPGGECRGIPFRDIPDEHKKYANQLLSREDLDTKLGGAATFEKGQGERVCATCNDNAEA